MPETGDQVEIKYTGTWTATNTVKLSSGEELPTVSASNGQQIGSVTVLKRNTLLAPGQTWRRNSDGAVYSVVADASGKTVTPAEKNRADVAPIPEQAFQSGQFTLKYDPRDG